MFSLSHCLLVSFRAWHFERGTVCWHSYKVFIALKPWAFSMREVYVCVCLFMCVSLWRCVCVCACVWGTIQTFVCDTKLFEAACKALTFCKGHTIQLQKPLTAVSVCAHQDLRPSDRLVTFPGCCLLCTQCLLLWIPPDQIMDGRIGQSLNEVV